jgi:hypothetical protein
MLIQLFRQLPGHSLLRILQIFAYLVHIFEFFIIAQTLSLIYLQLCN